jgi:hypothetical protein
MVAVLPAREDGEVAPVAAFAGSFLLGKLTAASRSRTGIDLADLTAGAEGIARRVGIAGDALAGAGREIEFFAVWTTDEVTVGSMGRDGILGDRNHLEWLLFRSSAVADAYFVVVVPGCLNATVRLSPLLSAATAAFGGGIGQRQPGESGQS